MPQYEIAFWDKGKCHGTLDCMAYSNRAAHLPDSGGATYLHADEMKSLRLMPLSLALGLECDRALGHCR